MHLIQQIEKELTKKTLPDVIVGDEVEVHYLIKEGDKERVQLFIGIVVAIRGRGIARMIVVRRIVQGEGVERSFPLHNPRVKDIVRRNPHPRKVRRAKLFYMRDRSAKENRLREIVGQQGDEVAPSSAAAPAADKAAAKPAPVKV